jgi:hypothetical protein
MTQNSNTAYVLLGFLKNITGPILFFVGGAISDWVNNILGQQIGIFNSPIARFIPLLVIAGIIVYGAFKTFSNNIIKRQWKRETYQDIDKNIQGFVGQGTLLSLLLSFNILCPGIGGDLSVTEKFFGVLASLTPTIVGLYQAKQTHDWVDRIYSDAHDVLEKIKLSGRKRFTEAAVMEQLLANSALFRKLHKKTQVDFVRQKMEIWGEEQRKKGEKINVMRNQYNELAVSFF